MLMNEDLQWSLQLDVMSVGSQSAGTAPYGAVPELIEM